MVTRVYSRATGGNAKRFLMDLLGALPFPLLSFQVEGGSEFMADFESACASPACMSESRSRV